jgi:hypothetical protein
MLHNNGLEGFNNTTVNKGAEIRGEFNDKWNDDIEVLEEMYFKYRLEEI